MDEFRRRHRRCAAGLTGLTFTVVANRFDALAVSDEHGSRAGQTLSMKLFVAALLLAVSRAAHRSGPAGKPQRQKPTLWTQLSCTWANLRRSGVLDGAAEPKESYLSRQLVAGRINTAAYQLAMTERALRN